MRALNSLPGMASIRTVASWSGLQPAAIGLVEPRFEMDRREIGQLEDRRARPGAIALAELLLAAANMLPDRKFGRMLTMPAAGALSSRFCSPRSARCRSNSAFSRFRRFAATSASAEVRSDLIFSSSSRSRCWASSSASFACSFSIRETVSPLLDVELGALDVVARLHQRGRVLLLGDARLRPRLLDLGVGLLQLRLLLLDRALQRRAVELHDDVAGLDRSSRSSRASGSAARPTASARTARSTSAAGSRRGSRGCRRTPLVTSAVGRSGAAPRPTAGERAGRQRRTTISDRTTALRGAPQRRRSRLIATAPRPRRSARSTAPSSRPDAITASCALIAPTVTVRSSKPEPRCTRTNARSPSWRTRRAARRAPAARAPARRRATRSGRASGSDASRSTSISTMNVRTFGDSVEVTPSGEICATRPAKSSSGIGVEADRHRLPDPQLVDVRLVDARAHAHGVRD